MAILDYGNRLIIPGNRCGSALIIGQDVVKQCDKDKQSTYITSIMNVPQPILSNGEYGPRGLYPSLQASDAQKRWRICMKAIYKITMPKERNTFIIK